MKLFNRTPEKKEAIFCFVVQNIDMDGRYNGVQLPNTKPITENPLVYWPLGGKEGILLSNGIENSAETAEIIFSLILRALENKSNRGKLYEKAKETDCLFYCVPLLEYLVEKENKNFNAIFDLAYWLIMESEHQEAVKLGLTLMNFFKVDKIVLPDNTSMLDKLILLGKCPEFTYYVLRIMKANGFDNNTFFNFTKTTSGWGKVFAIRYLVADTPEIKEWLLLNGLECIERPDEVALDLAIQCDITEILKADNISYSVYHAIAQILDYLEESEELPSLNSWTNTLNDFMAHSTICCSNIDDLTVIYRLMDYVSGNDAKEDIPPNVLSEMNHSLNIIEQRADWKKQIYENLCNANFRLSWCARWLAKKYQLDVFEFLFADLKAHPEKDHLYCDLLQETDPRRFGLVLEFAEQHINRYLDDTHSPAFIIQALKTHPHMGEYVLECALQSPVSLHTSMCLNVLETWGAEYVSKRIKDALQKALSVETNARNRQRIEKLLIGQVDDGSDFIVRI